MRQNRAGLEVVQQMLCLKQKGFSLNRDVAGQLDVVGVRVQDTFIGFKPEFASDL